MSSIPKLSQRILLFYATKYYFPVAIIEMLGGILPFLIQWLALSHLGSILLNPNPSYQSPYPTNPTSFMNTVSSPYPSQYGTSVQVPSQWMLLNDFANLSEDEIEKFLPQICNILLDYETVSDIRLIEQYERIIISKCANCLPFGIKVCSLLKAASQIPSEGLFRNLFPNANSQAIQDRQDRLRNIQMKIESATSYGLNLPPNISQLRCEYYRDMIFMMDSLARLGTELKSYQHADRNHHLRVAISQLNSLLHRRMLSKGLAYGTSTNSPQNSKPHYQSTDHMSFSTESFYNSDIQSTLQPNYPSSYSPGYPSTPQHSADHRMIPTASQVAATLDNRMTHYDVSKSIQGQHPMFVSHTQLTRILPQAAVFSLHFPLQHCKENVQKILRFVESECEVMPSRDRVPYLVIAELVEQPYECQSVDLYSYQYPVIPQQHLTNSKSSSDKDSNSNSNSNMNPSMKNEESDGTNDNQSINLDSPTHSQSSNLIPTNPHVISNQQNSEAATTDHSKPSILSAPIDFNQVNMNVNNKIIDEVRGGSSNDWYQSNANNMGQSPYSGPSPSYEGYGYQAPPSPNTDPTFHSNPYIHPNQNILAYPNGNYDSRSGNNNGNNNIVGNNINSNSNLNQRITFTRTQTWAEKKDMIRNTSPFGHLPGWTIKSFLVKSGDDLRKEMLAMQLIEYVQNIFRLEGIDAHLRPYQIMSTGYQAGLVEFLDGAKSVDRIKKSASSSPSTLKDYFDFNFGPSYSLFHATAVENFVKSLAGYSLVTYALQVKDRHNANLLIDPEGHIIHIDYGFILGDSPGFNINFENAPFKLTKEYIDVMGGIDSYGFKMFEDLFVRGFFALQKHIDGLITIIQLFYGDQRRGAVDALKSRLLFVSNQADVISLIRDSLESWRTKQYDMFQQKSNNISM